MQLDYDSVIRITIFALLLKKTSKFLLFANVLLSDVRWKWRQSDLCLPSFRHRYQLHYGRLGYFQIAWFGTDYKVKTWPDEIVWRFRKYL